MCNSYRISDCQQSLVLNKWCFWETVRQRRREIVVERETERGNEGKGRDWTDSTDSLHFFGHFVLEWGIFKCNTHIVVKCNVVICLIVHLMVLNRPMKAPVPPVPLSKGLNGNVCSSVGLNVHTDTHNPLVYTCTHFRQPLCPIMTAI